MVKELIVSRTFAPGTKLTAEGLAHRLGVSRTTVKGALDQLAVEGLVDVRPQVGTFVRGLRLADVVALWAARLMVDVFAAQRRFWRPRPTASNPSSRVGVAPAMASVARRTL